MTQLMTDLDRMSNALIDAMPALAAREQRLGVTLLRTLAKGQPVSVAVLANAATRGGDEVEATLKRWPGVFYDEQESVVGFFGLTVREMGHRFVVDGQNLWTWCAWDTLFLPELLGQGAHVSSTCPVTGKEITLTVGGQGVRDLAPRETVMSFLAPTGAFDASVIQSFCHFVHFFASPEAGEQWTSEHDGTFLISVDDAFELGARTNRAAFGDALATNAE